MVPQGWLRESPFLSASCQSHGPSGSSKHSLAQAPGSVHCIAQPRTSIHLNSRAFCESRIGSNGDSNVKGVSSQGNKKHIDAKALRAGEVRIYDHMESGVWSIYTHDRRHKRAKRRIVPNIVKGCQKFLCLDLGLFVSGTVLLCARAKQAQYHCRLALHLCELPSSSTRAFNKFWLFSASHHRCGKTKESSANMRKLASAVS